MQQCLIQDARLAEGQTSKFHLAKLSVFSTQNLRVTKTKAALAQFGEPRKQQLKPLATLLEESLVVSVVVVLVGLFHVWQAVGDDKNVRSRTFSSRSKRGYLDVGDTF